MDATVLKHLNLCYETHQPIDTELIDSFTTSVTNQTSNIEQFITVINQILLDDSISYKIDPLKLLVNLLEKFLVVLTFDEILSVYSPLFILENLNSDICLRFIGLNIHQDTTQEFLQMNNVLVKLLKIYFTKDTSIQILNQIEKLTSELTRSEFTHLVTPEYIFLFESYRKVSDTTILSRYLDYLTIILPNLDQVNPVLYQFNRNEILQFDDPLFLILLVQFYGKLLDQTIDIESSLDTLVSLYVEDKLDDLVKSEVINVVSKMSFMNKYISILDSQKIFKTHNLIKIFEHNHNDISLLSKVDPNIIYKLNDSIYQDILDNLSLFNDTLYFPVLLNFIKSPVIFEKLSPQFNYVKFSNMSIEKLYNILFQMSRDTHSKEYLFNKLPNILTQFVIDLQINNNQLWKLKLEILDNLLSDDSVNGYEFWKEELEKVVDLMKFGKRFRNVTKVDVMDEVN